MEGGRRAPRAHRRLIVYIGLGTLVFILVVLAIIYLARRA
jgi:hypothetical protein